MLPTGPSPEAQRALLAICLLPALLITGSQPADEVARHLAELAAPEAARREAAERWLALNLDVAHLPSVAESVGRGPAEVGRRLVTALGARDRNLPLAALLAIDGDARARAVGESAVIEMIARWNPAALDPPLEATRLPDAWTRSLGEVALLGGGGDSLADMVDRLERLAPGPAPLILDPMLFASGFLKPPREQDLVVSGDWTDWLREIARAWRLTFEAYAWREDAPEDGRPASPWIRLCKRGEQADVDGATRLLEWVRGVQRELDPAVNVACSQALAAVGWPAALEWLERRWIENDDQAALQGVLLAAGRGRVVPELFDGRRVRALLARCDRSLLDSAPGAIPRAESLARALAAIGPVLRDGSPLARILLEGWEQLAESARWVRLVALEGHGGGMPVESMGAAARERAAEIVAGVDPPWLAWQALRTLLALGASEASRGPGSVGTAVPGPQPSQALISWARESDRLGELARLLVSLAGRPPDGAAVAGLLPGRDLDLFRLDLHAHVPAGLAGQEAAELLGALLGDDAGLDRLAARLREWSAAGELELADALLARVRELEGVDPACADRLALRAGRIDGASARRTLDRIASLAHWSAQDAEDLGELCADSDMGWRARDVLLERMELDPAGDPVTPVETLELALRRAWSAMLRRRADLEAEHFLRRVREGAAESGHGLIEVLLGRSWPPPVGAPAQDLRREDRVLGG